MRLYEFGVGKIVKGVNTTVDVGIDEIPIQAKKFGNQVDRNGNPPVNPSGKIKLKEAVDYDWVYDTSAKFKVGGMTYNVDFIPISNTELDAYDVEFSAVHGPRFNNSGMMGQSSIQVFSTVIQTMGDFISKNHPDMLVFTGDKSQNRVGVYTKLLGKFENQLADLGYSVEVSGGSSKAEFTIVKNNNSKENS